MILLVDGNNLASVANSVGHACLADGFPTHAISGFLSRLRQCVIKHSPEKVFVAWDGGKSKKRIKALPSYKGSRAVEKKSPEQRMGIEELIAQMPVIKQFVSDMGLPQLQGPGIEADDLIALMVKTAEKNSSQVIIFSSDSDFHQLVSSNVQICSTMMNNDYSTVNMTNFFEKHQGLTPLQYLEYKSMVGDTSDDIPGIKGVGPVTALDLLHEYKNMDNWKIEFLAGRMKKKKAVYDKIIDQWDQFQTCKSLIDLKNPLADFSTARIIMSTTDWPNVRSLSIKHELSDIYVNLTGWAEPFKQLSL